MAAPRERGFRARFAGREFRPGMERDFALGFLSGFGQPMGASPMGGHPAGASAVGGAPMGPTTMGGTCPATGSAHRAWRAGYRRRAPARRRCRGTDHRPGTAAASSARSCRAATCSPTRSSS